MKYRDIRVNLASGLLLKVVNYDQRHVFTWPSCKIQVHVINKVNIKKYNFNTSHTIKHQNVHKTAKLTKVQSQTFLHPQGYVFLWKELCLCVFMKYEDPENKIEDNQSKKKKKNLTS